MSSLSLCLDRALLPHGFNDLSLSAQPGGTVKAAARGSVSLAQTAVTYVRNGLCVTARCRASWGERTLTLPRGLHAIGCEFGRRRVHCR